jgi:4-amino-4-deoxy-L-arabinose transferase-like glycosyltransferase
MIDVTLSFFVTLALFALVLALRRNKRYLILWGIAIGISILLKSILGFFPLVISIVFLIATKRWEIFYNLWFLVGGVIALGVGCSWYVHQYLFFGSPFLDVHFGWLILDRGFGGTPEPWYAHLSFLRDLLRHYWPWFPVFALGLYQFLRMALQKDENALLLVSWSLITLGVMSLTHQRILWYVMPVFPAAAIICGFVINGWLSETGRLKTIRWIAMTGLGASLVMNLTPLQLSSQREVDIRTIAPLVRHLVPQGATLTAFRYTYHSLNNPLLFYSDHAARPIFQNMSDLREAFNSDEALVCVVKAEDLDSILREIPNTFVVKRTSGACLIANRHFDVSWARTL